MSDPLDEVLAARERRRQRFAVKVEGKPPKPKLPELPDYDDLVGQCDFLTAVLHLDGDHPVISGRHSGLAGGRGHIALDRLDAPALEFKPASRIAKGETLAADLVWQLEDGDCEPYSWSNHQATTIARVVRWLCDASSAITSRQETAQILTTYLEAAADPEDGNTYGTTGERYDAVVALRPIDDQYGKPGRSRYLIDPHRVDAEGTPNPEGEPDPQIVIRVSDLAAVARKLLGSSIAHGWLDAQMEEFGWQRIELQGQSLARA